MFIIKKYYYLYIDNTKSINLDLLKKSYKYTIIYRTFFLKENVKNIISFKKLCQKKKIKFYIANNLNLAKKCKADGLYLSSYNKKIYHNINVIGAAHNYKEVNQKIRQRCKKIILSRLFLTKYKNKNSFYGILKFNLINLKYKKNLIPLGGINNKNLLLLNLVKSNGFALLSEIKKKPAIASRLF